MRFEHQNPWGADREAIEAELFYRDLVGAPLRRARGPRMRTRWPLYEDSAEAVVGQARIDGRQYLVDPSGPVVARGTALDDVLLSTLGRHRGQWVVLGDDVGGASFSSQAWASTGAPATPRRIEFDAAGVAALVTAGGDRLYLQSHPTSTTDSLEWVHVPSVEEFLRLPAAQRTSQRSRWVTAIQRAAAVNPATGAAWTTAQLAALSGPVLRLLLADNAAAALPASPHASGSVVNGVTLPMLRYPISEPQVYLRVISNVEGRMESINAWDAGAGISLGPIQVNVQRGALFRFLWDVWRLDRTLFTRTFGNDWTMRDTSGHPELSVPVAGSPVWLSGSSTTEEQRAIAYFMSGDPTRTGLRNADLAHRRRLAVQFTSLIAWPHVQEMLEDTSAWWLQTGLDQIHAAGIPALDPNRPDRDLFILKSLLMSTFVRFSGCLGTLLSALGRWSTVSEKLAHWKDALAAMGGTCSASGTPAQRDRNAILLPRLERQVRDAQDVFTALQAILAARAPVGTAVAQAAAAVAAGASAAAAAVAAGAAAAARTGEAFFDQVVAGRVWQVEGARAPHPVRTDFVGSWRPAEQVVTNCGFAGPTVIRTEQEVRQAVRDAALAEWTRWHPTGSAPLLEDNITMFGHLVRYFLSTVGAMAPDALTALQASAAGAITYAPVPAKTASDTAVRTWSDNIARLVIAGASGVTTSTTLASQVANAVRQARQAHQDQGAFSAWSAAWVSACVRGAGIQIAVEAMGAGGHMGRDKLIRVSTRHSDYTLEAHQRRVGPGRTPGTYQAFRPADRAPEIGDIIVQDRQARAPADPMVFADIASLSGGRQLHGDIVVEVAADHVVTIGGNLSGTFNSALRESCRKRRYPTLNGRLVLARDQLFAQELDDGSLQALPVTTTERLHLRSTLRILCLLSPVQECVATPGQPYGSGILT